MHRARSCCTPRGIYGLFSQVKRGRVIATWSTHLKKKRHPPWRKFCYFAVSQYRDKSRQFVKRNFRTASSKILHSTKYSYILSAVERFWIFFFFDALLAIYRGYYSQDYYINSPVFCHIFYIISTWKNNFAEICKNWARYRSENNVVELLNNYVRPADC